MVARIGGTISALVVITLVLSFMIAVKQASARARIPSQARGSLWHIAHTLAPFGIPLILLGLVVIAVYLIVNRVWIPAVARSWLAHGECPSCRYKIDTLEPEADGCTVCPECGSGWKVARTGIPGSSA